MVGRLFAASTCTGILGNFLMGGTKFIFVKRVKITRMLRGRMRALDDEARSEASGS